MDSILRKKSEGLKNRETYFLDPLTFFETLFWNMLDSRLRVDPLVFSNYPTIMPLYFLIV